jgi:hypothetical protein
MTCRDRTIDFSSHQSFHYHFDFCHFLTGKIADDFGSIPRRTSVPRSADTRLSNSVLFLIGSHIIVQQPKCRLTEDQRAVLARVMEMICAKMVGVSRGLSAVTLTVCRAVIEFAA